MTMVKKSITLTGHQNDWINAQIRGGQYGNVSEIVRELIRERQLREDQTPRIVEAIRNKLIRAEESGFTDQDPAEILKDIKSGLGA